MVCYKGSHWAVISTTFKLTHDLLVCVTITSDRVVIDRSLRFRCLTLVLHDLTTLQIVFRNYLGLATISVCEHCFGSSETILASGSGILRAITECVSFFEPYTDAQTGAKASKHILCYQYLTGCVLAVTFWKGIPSGKSCLIVLLHPPKTRGTSSSFCTTLIPDCQH